ncbi:MAG: aldehyde dehydrogenase family protein [Candidatus Rokuibacteriota bacterium]
MSGRGRAAHGRAVSKAKAWRDVVNPATQQVLARVPMCGADEVDLAVKAAEAFKTWRNVRLGARAHHAQAPGADPPRHEEARGHADAEQGKTLPDAEGDAFRGLEVVEHACSIGTLSLGEFAEQVANGVDTYFIRQPLDAARAVRD